MIRFTSAPRFFFIPDLTNGLSSTTFLYYRSFHFYWTSPLYNYYKKKICLNNKALPYSIIYLIYIILLPFIHPVRVRMLRPWSHLQVYEYQWKSPRECIHVSFFYNLSLNFLFFILLSSSTWHKVVCSPSYTGRENWFFFLVCLRCCGWRWS